MARAGDELVNQVTGLRTVFRKTARQTSGELLQVDWIGEPGWTTGPTMSTRARRSVSRSSPASSVCGWKASSASSARERRSQPRRAPRIHPLIHLLGDAAPPGRAVRYLVRAAIGDCALL